VTVTVTVTADHRRGGHHDRASDSSRAPASSRLPGPGRRPGPPGGPGVRCQCPARSRVPLAVNRDFHLSEDRGSGLLKRTAAAAARLSESEFGAGLGSVTGCRANLNLNLKAPGPAGGRRPQPQLRPSAAALAAAQRRDSGFGAGPTGPGARTRCAPPARPAAGPGGRDSEILSSVSELELRRQEQLELELLVSSLARQSHGRGGPEAPDSESRRLGPPGAPPATRSQADHRA
jgi:hypothetical protein